MSDTTPRSRQTKPSVSIITSALAALVLSFGLLFGVQYVQQQQNLQNQASQGKTIALRMNGQTVGQGEYRVDLFVNSQGYDLAGTQINGRVVGVSPNDLSVDLSNSLSLESVGSKTSASTDGTQFTFAQFAPLDKSKPVNTRGQDVKFASLVIRRPQGSNFSVILDQSKTLIPVVGNTAITLDATLSRSFTVGATVASARPSASPASSPGQPDRGLNRGCNQYCADKNECAAGFSCYFNRCRNPQNLTSESCSAVAARPTPRPTPVVPAASPRPAVPSPVPSPVASPSLAPSPVSTPSATPAGGIYDENQFRTSPSPTVRRPSPTPATNQAPQRRSDNRWLTAGIIVLVALLIVVPVGIYLYRRVR